MIDPRLIADVPILDPLERPVMPRQPHRNYLVPEVPRYTTWERIEGLSNHKETMQSDNESSDGSSERSLLDDSTEPHQQYPRPVTQHEEYLRLLQHHRTIESEPSIIVEAIRQHYRKWEGSSRSDSQEGSHGERDSL